MKGPAAALLLLSALLAACSAPRSVSGPGDQDRIEPQRESVPVEAVPDDALAASLPALNREFRGVWVATVDNIDWPSAPGLSTERQQDEMRAILDRAVELRLNAIVFQVRPTADALYSSDIEPWSAYLSGVQGRAPDPFYDPLRFAIEEAHARGLELHAWVNPFRAYHPTAEAMFDPRHVAFRDYTIEYGTQRWMDPGNPEAVNHTLRVIRDIVARYDVDGIHMDDYFYPYPVAGTGGDDAPFPDDPTWRAYRESGGDLTRPDWRRRNVDLFVERVYHEVRDVKPWVKFGVSPFGIWRPGYPDGITGFDAYNGIYADARKWLTSGWVDYLSPQLYWAMDSPGQSYPRLLAWWIDQNEMGRHIWPGNFTSRITLEGDRYWDAPELVRQIRHTQSTFGSDGNIHFSMQALMPSRHGMGEALREAVYREPALIPASPWLRGALPPRPIVHLIDSSNGIEAQFLSGDETEVWIWAVRSFVDGRWITEFVPGRRRSLLLPTGYGGRMPEAVAVSAVERTGLEGEVAVLRLAASNRTRRAW